MFPEDLQNAIAEKRASKSVTSEAVKRQAFINTMSNVDNERTYSQLFDILQNRKEYMKAYSRSTSMEEQGLLIDMAFKCYEQIKKLLGL